MPPILCFDEAPEPTLAAIHNTRQRSLFRYRNGRRKAARRSKHHRGQQRHIGRYTPFETITKITPAAALVLAAEYERIRVLAGARTLLVDVHRWNPDVYSTLNAIGFFQIVGLTGDAPPDTANQDVQLLPMTSGETADARAISNVIDELKRLYPEDDATDAGAMSQLYGAMVEAVVNVVRHAYPPGAQWRFKPVGRWWITGAVNRRTRRMTAVVFDHGISIPVSLPNWDRYAGAKRRILAYLGIVPPPSDTRSDGAAIAAAVEESVSSTGEPHRGHGLGQMRDFVNSYRDGYLRIISRHGQVIFRPHQAPEIRTFRTDIGGTLIEWSVSP